MAEPQASLDPRKYLDPRVLAKINRLEVKARLIVEGFITGMHRSPYHGFSIEFAEHREYVPGDDIRHIDWKVYGRSDRFYIKQYEEETNLKSVLVLDASESMQYGHDGVSKYLYGAYAAAALSYLLVRQQDAVGLAVFDEALRTYLPPATSQAHFMNIIAELDRQETAAKTDIGTMLGALAGQMRGKGLVVIISDLLDDPENITRGLRQLRHRGHEVVLFHLLDHEELTFPFQRTTLFEGMEGMEDLLVDPPALRKAYLAELEAHRSELKRSCRSLAIDYVPLDNSQKLDVPLTSYLAARAGRMRRGT